MSIVVELSDDVLNSLVYVVELAQSEYSGPGGSFPETSICPYCRGEAYYLHTL